jgi:hypothetical protein
LPWWWWCCGTVWGHCRSEPATWVVFRRFWHLCGCRGVGGGVAECLRGQPADVTPKTWWPPNRALGWWSLWYSRRSTFVADKRLNADECCHSIRRVCLFSIGKGAAADECLQRHSTNAPITAWLGESTGPVARSNAQSLMSACKGIRRMCSDPPKFGEKYVLPLMSACKGAHWTHVPIDPQIFIPVNGSPK